VADCSGSDIPVASRHPQAESALLPRDLVFDIVSPTTKVMKHGSVVVFVVLHGSLSKEVDVGPQRVLASAASWANSRPEADARRGHQEYRNTLKGASKFKPPSHSEAAKDTPNPIDPEQATKLSIVIRP